MKNLEEIKQETIDDVIYQKTLSNRENILYRKYFELSEFKTDDKFVQSVKDKLIKKDEIEYLLTNTNNKVELVMAKSKEDLKIWTFLRKKVSIIEFTGYIGRQMKYLVYINDKIVGILSLSSDVSSIGARDTYIGWNHDNKFKDGKLQHIINSSTVIPVQPFGTYTLGGKLVALLMFSDQIKNDYRNLYNSELIGVTTTSLFGLVSQYSGFPKYLKPIGETNGNIKIYPNQLILDDIRGYLRQEDIEVYNEIMKRTSPKQQMINHFYKVSGLGDHFRKNKINFNLEFKRGVYFSHFYTNFKQYLTNQISENQLIKRNDYDFDSSDLNSIVEFWKRKFAINRFEKLKSENKEIFLLESNVNIDDFIKKYS